MATAVLTFPNARHQTSAELHPEADQAFFSTLEASSHAFLQPSPSIHAASLVLAKRYLDPLATSTSETQIQRQETSRRKRKRGESYDLNTPRPLQLKNIHLEGFKIDQVWEQARRVLDATTFEVVRSLKGLSQEQKSHVTVEKTDRDRLKNDSLSKDDIEIDGSVSDFSGVEENAFMNDVDDSEEDDDSFIDEQDAGFDNYEDEGRIEADALADDFMDEDEDLVEQSEIDEESKETFVPDKFGLNDGFFSVDDFNRQSEFLERQDAQGENDGAASDEEDVDWDADPLAMGPLRNQDQDQDFEDDVGENSEDEDDEDEDAGPTFGNADLDAPDLSDSDDVSDDGIKMQGNGAINNTNDIRYAEFFEPPPRKASKSSHRRALPKTQPPSASTGLQPDGEDDIQRTISAVRRDIFEDDLTPDEDASDEDDNRKSSHQKRQAALTAEIRRLEAAAVAKRDWTLSGEARAADRPINSLLEEDLDFERTGKPIPVITQEVSEDIEALIKRRILAREFDEVIKRRPEKLVTGGADVRRGRFELEDTKPQQSLAEMYEAQHLKDVDPEGYVDKRDEKLKREHAKIEQMWKDVSAKLDALSSWHYKPKPPSASINVVTDVPKISMEDARPSAGGDVGGESMLAPQEVYKAGELRDKKAEVVTGSGLPVGREEMTRDEKTRRRRREKERIRKAGGVVPSNGGREISKKAKEKQGIVGDLKKGQVRIIGKKGEIKDVEGNAAARRGTINKAGASGFKL